MRTLICLLLIQWTITAVAAPKAGVMNFGTLSWSYELQESQGQAYCVVTVIRKDRIESQVVWPKPLCESRWDELERIVSRIKNPVAQTALGCAQQMELLTPSDKKNKPKKASVCWDYAGRASEAEFSTWWKKVDR